MKGAIFFSLLLAMTLACDTCSIDSKKQATLVASTPPTTAPQSSYAQPSYLTNIPPLEQAFNANELRAAVDQLSTSSQLITSSFYQASTATNLQSISSGYDAVNSGSNALTGASGAIGARSLGISFGGDGSGFPAENKSGFISNPTANVAATQTPSPAAIEAAKIYSESVIRNQEEQLRQQQKLLLSSSQQSQTQAWLQTVQQTTETSADTTDSSSFSSRGATPEVAYAVMTRPVYEAAPVQYTATSPTIQQTSTFDATGSTFTASTKGYPSPPKSTYIRPVYASAPTRIAATTDSITSTTTSDSGSATNLSYDFSVSPSFTASPASFTAPAAIITTSTTTTSTKGSQSQGYQSWKDQGYGAQQQYAIVRKPTLFTASLSRNVGVVPYVPTPAGFTVRPPTKDANEYIKDHENDFMGFGNILTQVPVGGLGDRRTGGCGHCN